MSNNNSRESIKVVCRLRPENTKEKESGCKQCITYTKETIKINVI
jgi:hypothetical protein